MNWSLLQTLHLLFETGSLAGAAKELGVDPTTISRRIASLEKALGMRMYDKKNGRYVPTRDGQRIFKTVSEMANLVTSISAQFHHEDDKISGSVKITSIESLSSDFFVPKLAKLRQRYPNLNTNFISSDLNLSLANREADIAVRLGKPDQVNIVAKKIGGIGFAVYAAAHIEQDWKDFTKLKLDWVTYKEEYSKLMESQWMIKNMLVPEPVLRSSDASVLRMAIKVGLGIGILPCYRGDQDTSLIRISGPIPIVLKEAWLLAPSNYLSNPAIRTVVEWIQNEFNESKLLLSGVKD